MENNISFSKIVATPTLNSWSQAYNAGKLFAVLSLEKTQELPQNTESLNVIGKDLLERLEQEFFTIVEKNLESIKKAISTTFQNQIEGIAISFASGAFVNNILYLFALGSGLAYIKRDGNLGVALSSVSISPKDITSSSGFLKEADLIVLATDAFSKTITNDDLNSSLNDTLPIEIAESLAPSIHKAEDGRISAIVIKYGNAPVEEVLDEETQENEELKQETPPVLSPFQKYLILLKSKLKRPNIHFNPTKKIFLAVSAVIVGILIFSIFLTIQSQNNAKMHALFTKVYSDALKKHDEGQSLLDLNKSLARDSFLSAKNLLNDNKDKFPEKSKESAQVQELLKKIENGLVQVSPVDSSGLDRSKLSVIVQNGSGIEGVAGKAEDILKELGYNVTSTGNADNYNYQGVTIKVKKEKSNFLNLLKKDLSKNYTIITASSDLPPDFPTGAVIIIGK
jgi:hypothetical protein